MIPLNPLVLVLIAFIKLGMRATNSCSKVAWELQIAFLKPPGECTLIFRRYCICSYHAFSAFVRYIRSVKGY
jgi:hypothetical protein